MPVPAQSVLGAPRPWPVALPTRFDVDREHASVIVIYIEVPNWVGHNDVCGRQIVGRGCPMVQRRRNG
jgi:hypothetical protein